MFMPGFFHCLKDNGMEEIRIIGVDSAPAHHMAGIIDAFYQVPSFRSPEYIDVILDICSREKVDIVFPHISMELELFAANRQRFSDRNIKLAMSNPHTLATANNKLELYRAMDSEGIPTPAYHAFRTPQEFNRALSALGYPAKDVCIKIPDGSGSRGVRIVSAKISITDAFLHQKPSSLYISAPEMRKIVELLDGNTQLIAMECLQMPEYTVDLLADNGKVLYIAGRLNTDSNMSIAMKSTVHTIPEAFRICTEIVQHLHLDGNIGFDFMFTADGSPALNDLNPRITATIVLFKEAGINFPYLRILQLLKRPLPHCTLREGTSLIRKYKDIIH